MPTAVPAINSPQSKWTSDEEAVRSIQNEVSEALFDVLNDQRQKLDQVDAKQPGKVRYQQARSLGCFAAVAKGAKDRELKPNRIFIPLTELHSLNGKVRISSLKATLPIPEGVQVKGVAFEADESEKWHAILEVKDVETCAS